jgi:hypothetical protein
MEHSGAMNNHIFLYSSFKRELESYDSNRVKLIKRQHLIDLAMSCKLDFKLDVDLQKLLVRTKLRTVLSKWEIQIFHISECSWDRLVVRNLFKEHD